jgi:beta-glucosidase
MPKSSSRVLALALFALALTVLIVATAAGAGKPRQAKHQAAKLGKAAFKDPDASIKGRVQDLLSQMTLEEKVGQMGQINVTVLQGNPNDPWDRGELNPEMLDLVLAQNHIGSILSGGGALPAVNSPRDWAVMTNTIQQYAIEHSRLHIPIIYGIDAVHGHNNVLGATMFPHQVGRGSSFDPALERRLAATTAKAVRATGIHWDFAPVSDTERDIRWGRSYEPYGEDPLLTGTMAADAIRAYQGDDLSSSDHVAATGKHFLGYSAPDSGKDRTDATISRADLQDLHTPPFKAGIDAGVETVMLNSSSINGYPVHGNRELVTGLLRDRLGFKGVVISDWQDVENLLTKYHVVDTYEDAIALAVNAGMDMSMVPLDAAQHTQNLLAAVNHGKVSMARIDEAVTRILTLKFKLGLFDHPYVDADRAAGIVEDPGNLSLARKSAAESLVLLRNNGVLPLSKDDKRVLVTGPSSDSPANQLGGWTIGWQGVPPGEVPEVTTLREGMSQAAPSGTSVSWSQGVPEGVTDPNDPAAVAARQEAVAAAQNSDVVVVGIGEPPYAETPGDTDTAALAPSQAQLVDELVATGKPVVLAIIAGRPLIANQQLSQAAASLMAFLPGTEGGAAIADVLFGKTNPSGRLSVSWPRSIGQVPLFYNHSAGEPYDPRYPFGWGLSYTKFKVSDLNAPDEVDPGDKVKVKVDLRNAGKRSGDHVVLAFVKRKVGPSTAPVRQLVAFKRTSLRKGDRKRVKLSFSVKQLAVTLPSGDRRVVPGKYRLKVGKKSQTFVVD